MPNRQKRKPTWAWSTSILTDILNFNIKQDEQANIKANFIIGACAIILIFTAGVVTSNEFLSYPIFLRLGWSIIAAGSFISFITAILVVVPRLRARAKGSRNENIFYYKNIIKGYTGEEYAEYLSKLKADDDLIVKAFASEIYSLCSNVLPRKFKLLKRAGWVLVWSLVIGIGLVMVNNFF